MGCCFVSLDVFSHPLILFSHKRWIAAVSAGT
jgi:hypothetical protein